jgi:hypothetical protein
MVIVFTIILILVLITGYLYVTKEGYEDLKGIPPKSKQQKDYDTLRSRLKTVLEPYCSLTDFIHSQMKQIYMADKVSELVIPIKKQNDGQPTGKSIDALSGGVRPEPISIPDPALVKGDSEAAANVRIMNTYRDVYNCTDDLAESRVSCKEKLMMKSLRMLPPQQRNMDFIPCSVYMNLPEYDENNIGDCYAALSKIPDNLSERVKIEIEWYEVIMDKLGSGIDEGKNPPPNEGQCGRKTKEGFVSKDDNIFMFERDKTNKTLEITNKGYILPPESLNPAGDGLGSGGLGSGGLGSGGLSSDGLGSDGLGNGLSGNSGFGGGNLKGGGLSSLGTLCAGLAGGGLGGGGLGGGGLGGGGLGGRSNAICSPAAAQAKRDILRRQKLAALEAEAASCKIPDISTEIMRINKLLDSKELNLLLAKSRDLSAKAKILQANLQALRNGNYYDWQKTGEKKTYKEFKIRDRISGLIASLQQNQ